MAQGRKGAHKILAFEPAGLHWLQPSCRSRQLRWRIERDYQELKQEVGLDHFEGRGWRGFHHHASLCIAAYGFLISEQETIPRSEPRSSSHFQASHLPEGYRSRGAAAQD
jgi:SRSO17 transposase